MCSGSFSTGSTATQPPSSTEPSNFWKKHEWRPVWHAMPDTCSTFNSTTSSSQSSRTSCTCCTWPDSSPLNHKRWREREKYTARPVSTVFANASRFIHANISTSFVDASCAITGTRPFASHLTLSSQFTAEGFVTLQPHRNALFGHEALGLAHGVLAVVEDARGQYCVRVTVLDAVGQMLQVAHATR